MLSMDRARNVKTFEALAEGEGALRGEREEAWRGGGRLSSPLLGGSLWSSGVAKDDSCASFGAEVRRVLRTWLARRSHPRGYLETTTKADAVREPPPPPPPSPPLRYGIPG